MQFIKNNYEKVVLSIVLLGLAVAAATLPLQVANVREQLAETRRVNIEKVRPKPFKPADEWLEQHKVILARLQSPLDLRLAGGHNLFNPVPWRKLDGNRIIPLRTEADIGAGAVKVTQIKNLFLTVSFDSVDDADPPRYRITVRRETDRNPRADTRAVSTAMPRTVALELVGVEGPANNPDAIVVKIKDFPESIRVTRDQPFERVIGYAADLAYENTRQKWQDRRTGDTIRLNDESENYKIVAIKRNEVVLESPAKKRTTLKHDATTTASIQ
jgi:hypothetical protein